MGGGGGKLGGPLRGPYEFISIVFLHISILVLYIPVVLTHAAHTPVLADAARVAVLALGAHPPVLADAATATVLIPGGGGAGAPGAPGGGALGGGGGAPGGGGGGGGGESRPNYP